MKKEVAFIPRGKTGRLDRIEIGCRAEKSTFLCALENYVGCTLDELFLDLLQEDVSNDILRQLVDWLRDKAKISYKGLSEDGLHWIMTYFDDEIPYRPWVSKRVRRRGVSCLYSLHLVCKKYGWDKVYRLLRGGEEELTGSEQEVLSLFEASSSVGKAVTYLNKSYSPLALVMPSGEVRFSFGDQPFVPVVYERDLKKMPAPVGVLFKCHADLTSHLEASLPSTRRFRGLSCYPNYESFDQRGDTLYFVNGEARIPAFPINETSMLSTKDGQLNRLLGRGIGPNPVVEGVVNSDFSERGHVIASGEVVLNFFGCAKEGSSATYLLLISCDDRFGSSRVFSLMDLNVTVKELQLDCTLWKHLGRYCILHGAVVVKPV